MISKVKGYGKMTLLYPYVTIVVAAKMSFWPSTTGANYLLQAITLSSNLQILFFTSTSDELILCPILTRRIVESH